MRQLAEGVEEVVLVETDTVVAGVARWGMRWVHWVRWEKVAVETTMRVVERH